MSNFWWCCKSCGWESYDSPNAYRHTSETGHEGHALVSNHIGAGSGSSEAGRVAARRLFEEARAHRRTCAADADTRPEEEK